MTNTSSPPLCADLPEEALRAYVEGSLPPPRAAEVEAHLAACSACCDRLADLPPDPFLALLQQTQDRAELPTLLEPPAAGGTPPPDGLTPPPEEGQSAVPAGLPQLPGYEVLRELGRGGMGVVYEAVHAVMGRRVAVKLIHPELLRQDGAVGRFRREVQAAARLAHPNLVTAFDAGEAGDGCFLAMELVAGETLAELLSRRGPLPVAEACAAVRQAALGLEHAHTAGLVHRDVKPQNLMRTADGTVKVLDFGLAALTGDRPAGGSPTAPNAVMGTPDYMAPEQAEDARAADARADVYSLGCTLFHLLTGQAPFPAETVLLKLLAHRGAAPPSARRLRREVPAALDAVLRRALAKRPAKRFRSAGELAAALEPFAGPGPWSARPAGRRRLLVGMAVALLLAALAVSAGVIRLSAGKDREVVIETDDPEVEVIVRGDRIVRIADPKTGRTYQLDRTDLSLTRADDPDGLRVTLDGGQEVALKRDGQRITTVRLEPKPSREKPASAGEKIGPVRVFGGGQGMIGRVHFLPDGHLALASGDPVSLWDVRTGQKVRDLTSMLGWFDWVTAVSPDGHRALIGTHLWDLETGKELRTLEGGSTKAFGLWDVKFSPDGRRAVFGSHKDPEAEVDTVWVCDVETGKLVKRFGKGEGARAVAYSPDGARIAAGHVLTSDDRPGVVRVYEVETGKEIRAFDLPTAAGSLSFSRDGKRLLSANDRTIRLWDLETGEELKRFEGHTVPVEWVVFTPDGRRIVSAGGDGTVRVWEIAGGKELCCFRGHAAGVLGVAVSPDGRHALSGSRDGTLRLWRLPDPPAPDPGTPRLVQVRRHALATMRPSGLLPHTYAAAFSSDGKEYAVGGDDNLIRLYSRTGELQQTLRGHTDWVGGVAFAPDGKRLASASADRTVGVWDTATGAEIYKLTSDDAALARSVDWSPDGKRLVSGGGEGTARIWDLEAGHELRCLEAGDGWCGALFTHGGARVVTWSDSKTLKQWDATTGELLATADGPPESVMDCRSLRGGKVLLVAGYDGLSWRDAADLKEVRQLKARIFFNPSRTPVSIDVGSLQELKTLVYFAKSLNWGVSPDGRFLVAAREDEAEARLWDLEAGAEVSRLPLSSRPSGALAFAPDGRHVAAGSFRGFVYLLRIEGGATKAAAPDPK